MRFLLGCLLCCLLPAGAFAQFGLSGHYQSATAPNWETVSSTDQQTIYQPLGSGFAAGIDYWFRLKNVRVEFIPTFAYARQQAVPQHPLIEATALSSQALHVFFNTNFYVFDFLGDCDCPTFSKTDPIFQRGFFLQLSPGLSHFSLDIGHAENEKNPSTNLAFSIGAGAGLDIGLTDVLTLTPQAQLRYYPSIQWSSFSDGGIYAGLSGQSSAMWQYLVGLRLGFRFDYK